jgi:hypothetical protein
MKMLRQSRLLKHKGQATTELAIMGAIVLMLLSYLVSQGFLYNQRQSLEMYTFRKALQLSKQQERGINLTVIRDVITPSFFSGLNRQRVMATSAVEYNPWVVWTPKQGEPEDLPSLQLLQVNEAMIRHGYFLEIPPTLVDVRRSGGEGEEEPLWINSALKEIDPQNQEVKSASRSSEYSSQVKVKENPWNYDPRRINQMFLPGGKIVEKEYRSEDNLPLLITFEDAAQLQENYLKDDLEGKIINRSNIPIQNIPQDLMLNFQEGLRRQKVVETDHPEK